MLCFIFGKFVFIMEELIVSFMFFFIVIEFSFMEMIDFLIGVFIFFEL